MRPRRLSWGFRDVLRAGVGIFSGVTGYLALFRPPALVFWFLRLGVTEWGYWLVLLALTPLLRPARRVLGGMEWLLSMSAMLAQLPSLQALVLARTLPTQLAEAFGHAKAQAGSRAAPLVFRNYVRGLTGSPVPFQRLVYAARGDESLHLDLYRLTTSHTPAPLVVVIHGGSWQGGGSEQLSALNHYLAARGYAVAAITYRLSPRHRFPAAHHDVVAALDYLTAHAGELGIDANKVVFLGRSAGAQLALLAAYTLRRPAIRGVVSLYGPTDLHWGYDHPANRLVIDTCRVLEDYLGGSPKEAPEVYTAASPMTFVDAHSPPTLLIHGAQDEMVFLENSRRLAARLTDAARPHFLVTLPWAAHGCDANFNGPSGQISTYAIEYFLNAVTSDAALS